MKYLSILLIITISLFAKDIKPEHIYKANGFVIDFVYVDSKLFVATDSGSVDIFDTKTKKLTNSIKVPKIINFFDEERNAKIFSVDVSPNRDTILILMQGSLGGREVFIKDKNLTKVISEDKKLFIKKAKFLSDDKLFLALLSGEIVLFDLNSKKIIYQKQITNSSFSDFAFNENKSKVAFSCESGEIFIIDTKTGTVIKVLKGANVDNVYKVDYKKGIVIGAGQDRRASIYNEDTKEYFYKQTNFLIYSASLSPSAKLGAFVYNEQNDIAILNIKTKEIIHFLKWHKSTINTIFFVNEEVIFSSSDDENIIQWRLK